ncbi:MAG: FtsX-like permease family protein [Rhodothermales bacterium]
MLKNYLVIALRTVSKQRAYTSINVFGMAIGLAVAMLIVLYVRDELSYDRFHEHAASIYRINLDAAFNGQALKTATSPAPMAGVLATEYPEVRAVARFFASFDDQGQAVRYEDRAFLESGWMWADSSVFDVMTFPLLRGDARTALAQPYSVVMTDAMAKKYFGGDDPLGQTVYSDGDAYRVTGILADIPSTSHLQFDFLASLTSIPWVNQANWVSNSFHTYVRLAEGKDPVAFEQKLQALVQTYVRPQVEGALGVSFDEAVANGMRWAYFVEPLGDLYLHSQAGGTIGRTGDITYVYVLNAIAVFILLIACINFMNLATARSTGRAREVGVRKVMGSTRRQLMRQFLVESMLMALAALGVASLLVWLSLGWFNQLADKTLTIDFTRDAGFFAGMLGITLAAGLLAGIYPAIVLSAFQPAAVLKGTLPRGVRHAGLRNALVVMQFGLSIGMLICAGVASRQLDFMQSKDVGFNKNQVLVLPITSNSVAAETMHNTLLSDQGVTGVAFANALPGRLTTTDAFRPEGISGNTIFALASAQVSHDYIETLEMDLVAGRSFSRAFPGDSAAYVVNEAGMRELGFTLEDVIGKRIEEPDDEAAVSGPIVGVVRDFQFESFENTIRPLVLKLGGDMQYALLRVSPVRLDETIERLRMKWADIAGGQPFDYFFLDDDFGRLYASEQRLGQIFGYFTALTVFIACLGLFGLASYVTATRTKEIGVRKVLGATVPQLVLLLSKEFSRLIAVAYVLAVPVALYAMDRWLAHFAYRVTISGWIIVGAGVVAILIALLTVSYQSIRTALADPVDSLRYE